ncbi:MAG: ribosome recycling factor [Victivallaceae bacterium]|nr:ribosome recycling factor [Victivallaceae bacterium]MDD4180087.1 ribosome recycling factor [Victivallaceae bacterium]
MKIENLLEETEEAMMKASEAMVRDFSGIRTGKASPALVESIQVDYYGSNVRMKEVAGITTPDSKSIVIQPWDRNALGPIEKAIISSPLGISPVNDGRVIRLPMPELSTERRVALSKQVKARGEDAKIAIRNARRDANDIAKKGEKNNELTEDGLKEMLDNIQKLTDDYTKAIDKDIESKETELMEI